MFRQEVGGTLAGEEAGGADADRVDLEAAEQLIQLSGGDGADDGGSESRSADSVKCRGADQAGVKEEKDKEVAVESRLRTSVGRFSAGNKDGDGGEPVRRSADSVNKCSRTAGTGEKGKEEGPAVESRKRSAARFLAGVVDGGEERRPRFRWLADIYRETRQLTT